MMALDASQDLSGEVYVRVERLGKGAFGEAVLYRKSDTNELVVWKQLDVERFAAKQYKEVENEIEILSLLNHPNIVAYYNHYCSEKMLYIEMEYANGGSLYDFIVNQGEKLIAEETVLWYFYQIVSALEHIHLRNILHRDIKTLNIFLTKSELVKLGDFGMSKMVDEKDQMAQSVVGTPYYMSPELVKGDQYNEKSDIWALGCVLHEMLTLEKTFAESNVMKICWVIVHDNPKKSIPDSYSPAMSELVDMCLQKECGKRASTSNLMAHSILASKKQKFNEMVSTRIEGLTRPQSVSARVSRTSDSGIPRSALPVVASAKTELYNWGGGKEQPQPIDFFSERTSALRIAVGGLHFAVITVDKEIFTWSAPHRMGKTDGELGHGNSACYKQPKLISAFRGVGIIAVACGIDFTACLSESGQLYTFGSNNDGCLGCGEKTKELLIPHQIEMFKENPAAQVSAGDHHLVAITKSQEIFAWGLGEFGIP